MRSNSLPPPVTQSADTWPQSHTTDARVVLHSTTNPQYQSHRSHVVMTTKRTKSPGSRSPGWDSPAKLRRPASSEQLHFIKEQERIYVDDMGLVHNVQLSTPRDEERSAIVCKRKIIYLYDNVNPNCYLNQAKG